MTSNPAPSLIGRDDLELRYLSAEHGVLDIKAGSPGPQIGESIEFVDSYQASIGLGFAVIAAAKAAKEGASLEGAVAAAQSVLDRTRIFILFHTLKYLEKGGRMGRASALFGSVLQIKPILTLKDGEIVPENIENLPIILPENIDFTGKGLSLIHI